jgi:hypothetical protein
MDGLFFNQYVFGLALLIVVILFGLSVASRKKVNKIVTPIKFNVNEGVKTETSDDIHCSSLVSTTSDLDSKEANKEVETHLSISKPVSVTMQSSCSNTPFDLQEFSLRMYKTGFVVQKTKDNVSKSRCIVINSQCCFCMYRDIGSLHSNLPSDTLHLRPSVEICMKELLDCFQCDGNLSRNFILEFTGLRTFHCIALSALDALYLVTGLKTIAERVRYDEYFFDHYAQPLWDEPSRFAHNNHLRKMATNRILPASPNPAHRNGSSGSGSVVANSPLRRWFKGSNNEEDDRSVVSTPSSVYLVSSKNNTPRKKS